MALKTRVRSKLPIKEQKILFLKSLAKNLNILTPALSECHIAYQTYAKWFKEDESFRKECMEVSDLAVDFVESKLMQLIQEGDKVAILFYLKCRRPDKWNDRQGQVNLNITTTSFEIGNGIDVIPYTETKQIEME